jgi:LuxR family maltose regulon positive regulatory protein
MIEVLVLQAVAREAMGDIPLALASLERALTLAEPEGYVRIFVDEGPAMAELLTKVNASRKGGTPGMDAYVHKLLMQGKPSPMKGISPESLTEPLSEREREVLRLLGSELKGPEMARELFISMNTLRTHTKSIFGKLGVNNRLAAVRRARELGLQ